MEKYNQEEKRRSGQWVRRCHTHTHTFPVTRGRPFAFQNKGCCWVTDMDAGRGIGTGNRSAGGGSLKHVQSDLRGCPGAEELQVRGHLG